jgi:hypothetical protein
MLEVFGEIRCRPAPATKFALDRVAVGQCSLETSQLVCHKQAPSSPALSYAAPLETARSRLQANLTGRSQEVTVCQPRHWIYAVHLLVLQVRREIPGKPLSRARNAHPSGDGNG